MSRKRTPDEEPSTETTSPVSDPPATEPSPDKPSFAERVGKKNWRPAPDPFGIASDYIAGIRLLEYKQDRQMAIKFEEKPSQAVLEKLKEAGYHWNAKDRRWAHPLREGSAHTTREEATDLYNEILRMMQQEKGIEAGPEVKR